MGKVKICPGCGRHNPPGLLECPDCEEDMTAVPITDEGEVDKTGGDGRNPSVPVRSVMVRICDACGERIQHRPGAALPADLTMIAPVPETAGDWKLVSLDNQYTYCVKSERLSLDGHMIWETISLGSRMSAGNTRS